MLSAREFNRQVVPSYNYSRKSLMDLLRRCGLPSTIAYCMVLEKELIITKGATRGTYRFIKTPVHYMEFERAYRKMRESVKPTVKKVNTIPVPMTEENAIKYLKEKGYLILKQL